MVKNNITIPKTKYINTRQLVKILLKNQMELDSRLNELRRDLVKLVDEKVEKNFGDKLHMIESAIDESIIHKEILISKGILTRKEVNQEYKKLREKRGKNK